ncbi:hypothetical protein [Thermococcus gorgonarius]|uniref:Uncharacterized protein n=1 Tax=Thermococcus gorgonarius TaxID=71997 RepID=A0A2Z2M855_THEGO|nr:hypothetical protein [Thermococcus gorgonarius]ASJ00562.1 hypothetical protein A3K92_03270 [Thermococcus gorgonarius]
MERLRGLMGRRHEDDPLDYVRDLTKALLEGKLIGEEVLFRDAVGEIYSTLRKEVLSKTSDQDYERLLRAYELAVILRYLVQDGVKTSREILEELLKTL